MKSFLTIAILGACCCSALAEPWTVVKTPVSSRLNGVVQIQNSGVFVVGSQGTMINSFDGGTTWKKVNLGFGNNAELRAIAGFDTTAMIGVGSVGTFGHVVPDASWYIHPTTVTYDLYALCSISDNTFFSVGKGGLLVWDSVNPNYRGTCGFYCTIFNPQYATRPVTFRGVTFMSRFDGIVVGDSGAVLTSHNGGVSWKEGRLPSQRSLRAVASAAGTLACAVGDSGSVWISVDSGATWHNATPPFLTANLHGVAFAPGNEVIAVGDGGLIIASNDTGRTWHREAINTFADLYGINCWQDGSTTNWIVVGDSGVVARTKFGGGTVSCTKDLHNIDFGDVWLGTTRKDSVHVSNISANALLPVACRATDSVIKEIPNHFFIDPLSEAALFASYSPRDTGRIKSSITITTGADWLTDTVTVTGRGIAAFGELSANRIDMGFGVAGTSDSLFLRNVGNAPLHLISISVSDADFSVRCDSVVAVGDSVVVRVSIAHSTLSDTTARIILTTNDFRMPRDTFYVSAKGTFVRVVEKPFVADAMSLMMYPNPVSSAGDGTLTLAFDGLSLRDAGIVISDCLGREVFTQPIHSSSGNDVHRINLAGLAAGSYVCMVSAGDHLIRRALFFVR